MLRTTPGTLTSHAGPVLRCSRSVLHTRTHGANRKRVVPTSAPIEVNQTTLHYFECGQGEPLVFVHGAFGDLQTFREQLEAFATSFRVIVYSRRFFRSPTLRHERRTAILSALTLQICERCSPS